MTARTRAVVLCVALVAGAFWRLRSVGEALLFGDELHSLGLIERGYGAVLTSYMRTGAGLALPLLQRVLVDLFGPSSWSLRAPAWVPALVLLGWCYWALRPLSGRSTAAIATLLVAVNPLLVFYAHFARAYALQALLCFALFVVVERTVRDGRLGGGRALAAIALCAAAPWVHLTSLASSVGVVAAGAVSLWAAGREATARRLLGALGLGTAGAALLHAPARESLFAFVGTKTSDDYFGSFGALDVAALLVGDAELRGAATLATALALGVVLVRERSAALPLLAGCVAPALAVWAVRPYGDAYAYARYLIPLLPLACVAFARAIAILAERAPGAPGTREAAALAAGAGLALALFVRGPLWRDPATPGPHANTYPGMLALPDFDRPWPGASPFWAELARTRRPDGGRPVIVETPALLNRWRHLYRNAWLQHRAPTRLAFTPREVARRPGTARRALADFAWLASGDADFAVVHVDIAGEIDAYFRFVFGEGRDARGGPRRAYMQRHGRGIGVHAVPAQLLEDLTQRFGAPVHRDRHLAVWRLSDRELIRDGTPPAPRVQGSG